MTSPAPLDPGLERQPGEPVGSYVTRLEDTHGTYLRSAAQIAARLALIESACAGSALQLVPEPPIQFPPPAPSGAQAGQEGASGAAGAPPPSAAALRASTVRLANWASLAMRRDHPYLLAEVAESSGMSEARVRLCLPEVVGQGLICQQGTGDRAVYVHPAQQQAVQ